MNINDIDAIDLNLLRVFEALHEEGGASRAAIRLGLTQSAVSAALARLRRVYADPLFERTGRGLQPTARADALAPLVGEALARCRQALALSAAAGQGSQGRTVAIGLSDDYEIAFGPALLAKVGQRLPGLRLLFRQSHSAVVQEMLLRHQVELAISAGGLASHLVRRETLGRGGYLCVSDKRVRRRLPRNAAEFADREHLLVSSGGVVGIVDEALAAQGLRRRIAASTTHFAAVPHLLRGSERIATVPAHAARALEQVAGLTVSACPLDLPAYAIELGMRQGSRRDAALQTLAELVSEVVGLTPA